MKKTFFAATSILLLIIALSACQSKTEVPRKRLPKDVVSTSPQPYTGEPGQQGSAELKKGSPELKVYSLNEDGTSQEVSNFKFDSSTSASENAKTKSPTELTSSAEPDSSAAATTR